MVTTAEAETAKATLELKIEGLCWPSALSQWRKHWRLRRIPEMKEEKHE